MYKKILGQMRSFFNWLRCGVRGAGAELGLRIRTLWFRELRDPHLWGQIQMLLWKHEVQRR